MNPDDNLPGYRHVQQGVDSNNALDIFLSTLVLAGTIFVVRLRRSGAARPSPAFHGLVERNDRRYVLKNVAGLRRLAGL